MPALSHLAPEDLRRAHPACVFCGGRAPTETVLAVPAPVLFWAGTRPEGFEYPACARCAAGRDFEDAVAAVFTALQAAGREETRDDVERLLAEIGARAPDVLAWFPRRTDAAATGISVALEKKIFRWYLEPFAVRQALALHAETTGRAFPASGVVFVRWAGHEDLAEDGLPRGAETLMERHGVAEGETQRPGGGFAYRAMPSADGEVMALLIGYHGACGFRAVLHAAEARVAKRGRIGYRTAPGVGIHRLRH